jgi:hypothetical protein
LFVEGFKDVDGSANGETYLLAIAMLKVIEDIRLSMEDGQVRVLLILDFSQAFDKLVHELLLCKLQNAHYYSVGAGMLVALYFG